jgi:TolB-like protein
MMYSIVNEEPEPIERSRPDIPPELVRIIKRSLEKDREDRYQHVDDMVSELRRMKKQSARLTQQYVPTLASLSPDRKVSEAAQPPTSATAPRPSRKGLSISIISAGVVLVGIVGYILFRGGVKETATTSTGRKMLVVLPFENLGSPDQEYFADGITEEITSKLSGLSGLGVIARSSAMQYKKTTKPIKQIGDELGVSYVLQGTIRWESIDGTSRVRVNPQLINVADGTQIWSQPSVAVLSSAFELQSQIAGHVADALNITLLQHEKQSLEAKLTDNAQAYDAYLRGIEYQFRSTDERDYRIAEQMFQRAVDLDRNLRRPMHGSATSMQPSTGSFMTALRSASGSPRKPPRKHYNSILIFQMRMARWDGTTTIAFATMTTPSKSFRSPCNRSRTT